VKVPDSISTTEIAGLFGVSRKTVAAWTNAGILVRTGRGRFDFVRSVRGLAKHRQRSEPSGDATAGSARSRLTEAQAIAVETKNAVARGELISEAEVDAAWAEVALLVRTAVMDGVERAAGELPHLSRTDVSVIDRVMRGALTALRQPQL
jgi:terminase small subunit / prophage DNA-packing protein